MSSAARVTVVIVNFNGAHLLPACLNALREQQIDAPPFDTVVVDNASADGSRELLARDFPWVEVIASSQNLGFAGGNNLALRRVTTPYAVLLNNDAVPEPGWLRALIAELEQPGNHDVGIATGKIVFLPRFATVRLETPGFRPDTGDTRDLGVQVYAVHVNGVDVTEKVLWGDAAYGPEGSGDSRFRWTRPGGEMLIPLAPELTDDAMRVARPVRMTLTAVAQQAKPLILSAGEQDSRTEIGTSRTVAELLLPAGTPAADVINNVGGIVLADGSGADRGFQEIDRGQYDEPAEVFTACGNGMAMRTAVGHELGWFDDRFFMYYEDTDLSWRWRSRGWSIHYVPAARLRHIHSASSKEWSPRWMFHVERNRLLMLTKNASPALAARAVYGYVRTTVGLLAHSLLDAVPRRRRPALRAHMLRIRVLSSYSRQAPNALRQRRTIRRRATVSANDLQGWLVETR